MQNCMKYEKMNFILRQKFISEYVLELSQREIPI